MSERFKLLSTWARRAHITKLIKCRLHKEALYNETD